MRNFDWKTLDTSMGSAATYMVTKIIPFEADNLIAGNVIWNQKRESPSNVTPFYALNGN